MSSLIIINCKFNYGSEKRIVTWKLHDVIYKIFLLHAKQGTENYMKFAFQIIINGIPYLFLLQFKGLMLQLYNYMCYFNQNNKNNAEKNQKRGQVK